MITDLDILMRECEDILLDREYRLTYQCKIKSAWQDLDLWMKMQEINVFSEEVGFRYADEILGGHILSENFPKKNQIRLRAVRMLTSYQKDGDFEFRTPSSERYLDGEIGELAKEFLESLDVEKRLSGKTITGKRLYLADFSEYTNNRGYGLKDITMDVMADFFVVMGYSLASRHCCGICISQFFHFLFDRKYSDIDLSIYILKDGYRKNNKLPTTYSEDEIKSILASVERGSALGKRDYLILLLAAEYGWRTGDIVSFCFDQIDWDNNVIRFYQQKTDVPAEYPLLASVGNAIIDYLKYGRPKSDAPEVIVSHCHESLGRPLSPPTVHSVVSRYMKAADIPDWKEKRHGAHSLRHSLATNMLKRNVALPVISTVMGHQRTETTKIYLKVDVDKLAECSLAIPPVQSQYYEEVVAK